MTVANSDDAAGGDAAGGLPAEAIESVAFLARSEHRLQVLGLLADGACTRDEMRERTDVTRVTLSRILGDLEDRELITRHHPEGTYELTTFGRLVYRDFAQLLGTVSVGRAYPELVERLPTDWFDFDLRCLADGELVSSKSSDPLAAARVVANAVREAPSCRSLVGTFISLPMYAHAEEIQCGIDQDVQAGTEQDVTVVFDSRVTGTMLDDPSLFEKWQEIEAATESTVYYSVDDRIPFTVDLVGDDTVFLTLDREHETGFDILRCTHPDVVEWAGDVIDEYRDDAVALSRRAADGPT